MEIKNSRHWEALFLELHGIDSKPVIIGNIYRPPRSNNNNRSIDNFINEFHPIINNIISENKYTFIGGDFNIDLLLIGMRQKYAEFLDLMLASGFLPRISYPTRFSKKSASLFHNQPKYADWKLNTRIVVRFVSKFLRIP